MVDEGHIAGKEKNNIVMRSVMFHTLYILRERRWRTFPPLGSTFFFFCSGGANFSSVPQQTSCCVCFYLCRLLLRSYLLASVFMLLHLKMSSTPRTNEKKVMNGFGNGTALINELSSPRAFKLRGRFFLPDEISLSTGEEKFPFIYFFFQSNEIRSEKLCQLLNWDSKNKEMGRERNSKWNWLSKQEAMISTRDLVIACVLYTICCRVYIEDGKKDGWSESGRGRKRGELGKACDMMMIRGGGGSALMGTPARSNRWHSSSWRWRLDYGRIKIKRKTNCRQRFVLIITQTFIFLLMWPIVLDGA